MRVPRSGKELKQTTNASRSYSRMKGLILSLRRARRLTPKPDMHMNRSAEFGRGLAHYIHRKYTSKSPLRNVPYILLGHSLGANIIFHCLEELYNLCKNDPTFGDGASCPIIEVHLLGGVPRAHDDDTWRRCVRVVRERICNYHSSGDEVLRVLPGPRIGRHPIQVGHGRILNVTAPEVKSHILWKSDLDVDRVLDKTTVSGYLVKKVQCDTTQASSDCKLREMEREFRERAREIDDVLLYLKQVAVELGEAA
ncbi:Transmembrane and coiled-coil domain-containing protein 4 [Borealophlyctis nickersoniae]|nr:Transmembrane and coiled-coil domain-containing protein 4 [Borealophlyctis nickersoniae]